MGKAIVIGVVIVVVVAMIVLATMWFRRKDGKERAQERGWALKGDLNARQEKKLKDQNTGAELLFYSLLLPSSDLSREMTILSREHRDRIEKWLAHQSESSGETSRRSIDRT